MINLIEIIVNKETLAKSSSDAITGNICFKVQNRWFPEPAWNDFVVIALTWWTDALLKINRVPAGAVYEFAFMDGPYLVRFSKISDDTMCMEFLIRRINSKELLFDSQCSIEQFNKSLKTCVKMVITTIKSKGWVTLETKELISRVNSL